VQTTKPSFAISLRLAVAANLQMVDGASGFWDTSDVRLAETVALLMEGTKFITVGAAVFVV
jgi:hypothetical protein